MGAGGRAGNGSDAAAESLTDRLDRFQRRHPHAAVPLAVLYKFFDDQGNYLAALIAFYGFLSLVPLLLLSSTVLGFVLQGHRALQRSLLNSALGQFPVVGHQLADPHGIGGSGTGSRSASSERSTAGWASRRPRRTR